jgi:hypothetical protein
VSERNVSRVRAALDRINEGTQKRRRVYGVLGRLEADGSTVVRVAGDPTKAHVRVSGQQASTVAFHRGAVNLDASGGQAIVMWREDGQLHIEGYSPVQAAETVTSPVYARSDTQVPAVFDRFSADVTGVRTALYMAHITSQDMDSPFGVGIQFAIEDNAGVRHDAGFISAQRDGNDSSGRIVLTPMDNGTPGAPLIVHPDGRVQMPFYGTGLAVFDSVGMLTSDPHAGGGNGNGSGLIAGHAIDITGSIISVDMPDLVGVGDFGLEVESNTLRVRRATDSGLSFDGGLKVNAGAGLALNANAIDIDLASPSGLTLAGDALAVADSLAGTRLVMQSKVLDVDQGASFTWTGTHTYQSDVFMANDLVFQGLGRAIRTQNDRDLRIEPDGDGVIHIPEGTDMLSPNHLSGFMGRGWRISNPAGVDGLAAHLDIRSIYAEELHVTTFTADNTRVLDGETVLANSMGIIAAVGDGFVIPAINQSATIYIEDNPAMQAAVFGEDDWVMLRFVDREGGGLTVATVWGQVADYAQDPPDPDNASEDLEEIQSYTFTTRYAGPGGAAVGYLARPGFLVVGLGQPGDFYIWQSAIANDGPWERYLSWDTVPFDDNTARPAGTLHMQIGNLDGVDDPDLNPVTGFGIYSDNAYLKGALRTSNTVVDDNGLAITHPEAGSTRPQDGLKFRRELDDTTHSGVYGRILSTTPRTHRVEVVSGGSPTDPDGHHQVFVSAHAESANASQVNLGTSQAALGGSGGTVVRLESAPDLPSEGLITLAATRINIVRESPSDPVDLRTQDLSPYADLTYDLGTATRRWDTLYVGTIIADTVMGEEAMAGQVWQYDPGDMFIRGDSSEDRLLTIHNQGTGIMDVLIEGDLTADTLNGVDLPQFVADFNTHIIDSDIHHPRQHDLDSTADHTGTLSWDKVNKTGSDLADLATRSHSDLTGRDADDHGQYVHVSIARTIQAQHTFNPGSGEAPFLLHSNAQGQTVAGFRADELNKSIDAGDGLSGGGLLTEDRALAVDTTFAFSWGAQHTFNPGSATAPFLLHSNAQGQTVAGLRADQLNKSILPGDGLSGGGLLTQSRTLAVDATVVRTSRQVLAGDGLTGGGDLSQDRTITLGTPGTIALGSANNVTAGGHVHAVDASANPGEAASLVATSAAGVVQLVALAGPDTFVSGFTGSGYRIDDGVGVAGQTSAEFDNLTVRGRMRIYELLAQQIRATNGSLFVSSSSRAVAVSEPDTDWMVNGQRLQLNGENASFVAAIYTLQTGDESDNDAHLYHGFLYGDLIRAQRFEMVGGEFASVSVTDMEVTGVNSLYEYVAGQVSGDAPTPDIEFTRLGSSTDPDRRGSVYLTADDSAAPYIDIVDDVAAHNQWNTSARVKARLGNLAGITDADFGGSLAGYGLYADNVYLKGEIIVTGGNAITEDNLQDVTDDIFDQIGEDFLQVGTAALDINAHETTIHGGKITTGTILAAQIAAGTITAAEIAAGTITANELAADYIEVGSAAADVNAGVTTIDGGQITADSITATQLAADYIQVGDAAADVNAGATTINGGQITTNTITATQIAGNTITASQIAANAISATEIQTSAVIADKIQAGAVTADKINVATLSAITGSMGELTIDDLLTIGTSGEIRQGTGSLGSNFTGLRIWRQSNVGRIGGYNDDVLQWGAATDGSLTAGVGAVQLDAQGIFIEDISSADYYSSSYNAVKSLKFGPDGGPHHSAVTGVDGLLGSNGMALHSTGPILIHGGTPFGNPLTTAHMIFRDDRVEILNGDLFVDGVPTRTRRRGGSGSNWGVPGSTAFTPSQMRMQLGAVVADGTFSTVTFPVAFQNQPVVTCTVIGVIDPDDYFVAVNNVTSTGFQVSADDGINGEATVHWVAIGPG